MKVIATQKGFYGHIIEEGEVFEVHAKTKGSWFEPVKGQKQDQEDDDVKKTAPTLGA